MNSEIEQFLKVLGRRWLVIVVVCAIGFGLMALVAIFVPAYKASAELLIVSEALKDTTLSDPDLPPIITSTEVLSRVIDRLKLKTEPTALARKIKIKLPAKSSILELSYQDADGGKAAAVTNAIADEAALYFHEIATRGYTDVLKVLNRRIADTQSRIAAADKLLARASASNGYASFDKALDDATTQVDELRAQRGQLAASLAADQATAAGLEQQLRKIDPIVRGEILAKDVVYQQLQAELAKDVADLISERASFHESFPGLAALAKRVARERNQLITAEAVAIKGGAGLSSSSTQTILDGERAAGLVGADVERLRATDIELTADQKRLRQIAGTGAVVGTLRAKRDAALQQYLALTGRLSSAQGDAAQAASLGRLVVVSRAIPGSPVQTERFLAIAVLVLANAICAAFAADALDRRFWGVREIENVYRRPIFAEVGARS